MSLPSKMMMMMMMMMMMVVAVIQRVMLVLAQSMLCWPLARTAVLVVAGRSTRKAIVSCQGTRLVSAPRNTQAVRGTWLQQSSICARYCVWAGLVEQTETSRLLAELTIPVTN